MVELGHFFFFLAIKFDQASCVFVTHTSLNHIQPVCVFHISSSVIFIIGLVNSSPNVALMVVAKKFSLGLITPNDFGSEV